MEDRTLLLLLAPLIVLELMMKGVALFSLSRRERVRGPKLLWVLLILFVSPFGWVLYFVVGREPE